MGSGKASDSFRPAGSVMPETLPLALYSFQAEPEMYPRTTHSMGNISARCTSMERPRSWSAYLRTASGVLVDIGGDQVVRNDVGEVVEPEQGNLAQHASLMRDAGGQNVVESGNTVGGHKKQLLVADAVDVAHLAAGVELEIREVSF